MSEPDQRLYFLLQRAAQQLRITADRRLLAVAGITTAQLGALLAVGDEQPGITQQRLAQVLQQRESGVTALVRRLCEAGLITRRRHPDEHRAVLLELTARGHEVLSLGRPEIDRFNAELRALLGADGFTDTTAALRRLMRWGT